MARGGVGESRGGLSLGLAPFSVDEEMAASNGHFGQVAHAPGSGVSLVHDVQIAWLRLWRKQVGGVSGADQYRAFVSIIGASELRDYEYGLPLFVARQGKAVQRVPIRQVGPERLFLLRVHTCQGRNKRCASDKCKNRARLSRPDDRQAG